MTGNNRRNHAERRVRRSALVIALGMVLSACDPGGRLAQLTPPPPVATPMLLGVTTEAPSTVIPPTDVATPVAADPTVVTTDTTPVYDPNLPDWTILYFASADNDRSPFVLENLNEMEAGATSDRVQVVAQIDWAEDPLSGTAEGARYHIMLDEDEEQFTTSPVSLLGELNMGEPATLADFLLWATSSYPANRYALVLDGFGGGWYGCCLDNAVGPARDMDFLSLNNLDQALAIAQAATGGVRWNVIAFGASLMSQLDVLQVVSAYADYAVASPGLVAGSNWDFRAVLSELNGESNSDASAIAQMLVHQFMVFQQQALGDEYASMTAIDLARLHEVTASVESLALALAADPAQTGGMVADARRGAQPHGAAAVSAANQLAAVDLLHAAAILFEVSEPGDIQSAATAVTNTLNQAILAHEHGLGVPNSRGIAIYWPASTAALNPRYFQVTRLPIWAGFLANFVNESGNLTAPIVSVNGGPRAAIGVTNPALMSAKVIGRHIDDLTIVAAQEAADGRRVLRQYQAVEPASMTLPAGTTAYMWPDGYHESLLVWDPIGGFLADVSGTGDFVAMQTVDTSPVGAQIVVQGYFRHAGSERSSAADLTYWPATAVPSHLWMAETVGTDGLLVGEVPPSADDVFMPATLFLDSDGRVSAEPGVALVFDDGAAIVRSTRPLPAGNYDVGASATSIGDASALSTAAITVDPLPDVAEYRAFVDAAHGVQFIYPLSWQLPAVQENATFTSDGGGLSQLQVRYYPNWASDLASLQSQVLETFGDVSVLWQEPALVSESSPVEAMRTAYGYSSTERGERTGVFVTFVRDGVGYMIDLDAPRDVETATLALMDAVAATWQFVGPRLGFGPDPWSTLDIGNIRVAHPTDYAYQEFNGWHRFAADPQTFVAVRIQPAGRTPPEAMASLLETAAEGVAGFEAEEPERFFYAGHIWQRNDFTYVDPTGASIQGLLLARHEANQEIAIWGEARADSAETLFDQIFLPTAATVQLIPAPPAG